MKQHYEDRGRLSKLLTAAIPSHLRPHIRLPHIDVISATKAVTPEFVSSTTIDAATSEQENPRKKLIKFKTNKTHEAYDVSLIVISGRRRPLSFYFLK